MQRRLANCADNQSNGKLELHAYFPVMQNKRSKVRARKSADPDGRALGHGWDAFLPRKRKERPSERSQHNGHGHAKEVQTPLICKETVNRTSGCCHPGSIVHRPN